MRWRLRSSEIAHGRAVKKFPQRHRWVVPYDTSKFVEISIREVLITLAEAMLLVFW